jgi:hypothetical protein
MERGNGILRIPANVISFHACSKTTSILLIPFMILTLLTKNSLADLKQSRAHAQPMQNQSERCREMSFFEVENTF